MARVLLAEDDTAMRELVRRALSADGHEVVEAQDGQDALDAVKRATKPFDVMLTDIQMPSLDGLALAAAAGAVMPHMRVLLMTAFASGIAIPDALKPRVLRVLTKPLTLEQVRDAVRAALVA